jgi:hypothetical protein
VEGRGDHYSTGGRHVAVDSTRHLESLIRQIRTQNRDVVLSRTPARSGNHLAYWDADHHTLPDSYRGHLDGSVNYLVPYFRQLTTLRNKNRKRNRHDLHP